MSKSLNQTLKPIQNRDIKRHLKHLYQPDSLFSLSPFVNGIILFCVFTDIMQIRSSVNLIMGNDSYLGKLTVAIAIAIALDVSMALLGSQYAKYTEGYIQKSRMIFVAVCAITAFAIGIACLIWVRVEHAEMLARATASSGGFTFADGTAESTADTDVKYSAVLIQCIVPLITSVVSFFASVIVSSPTAENLRRCHLLRVHLQDQLADLNGAILEADGTLQRHLELEEAEYRSALQSISGDIAECKDRARQCILLRLEKKPESVTSVTEEARETFRSQSPLLPGESAEPPLRILPGTGRTAS